MSAIQCSIAASTPARSSVARRSSRRPRVTASPSRAKAPRILVRHPHRLAELGRRTEPRLDDAVEELVRGRATVERLAVDLEEEPLEGPERRVGDVAPPGPRRVLERQRRIGHEVADRRQLPAFDLVDDGHPQPVLRAEVMAEHAVARAQFRRQPSQREIREAVHLDVVDRGVEQLLSGFSVRHRENCTTRHRLGVPSGTCPSPSPSPSPFRRIRSTSSTSSTSWPTTNRSTTTSCATGSSPVPSGASARRPVCTPARSG